MTKFHVAALAALSLSLSIQPTHAGWFGPSNYNECMVSNMKGQPAIMVEIILDKCIRQFPCNAEFLRDYKVCTSRPTTLTPYECLNFHRYVCPTKD